MDATIRDLCARLEKAGVQGVPKYGQSLIANSTSVNFEDFLLEGKAALLFRQVGFHVAFREAPDLALGLNGEELYAEVKHFRLKEQDSIDDAKMSEPGDLLVPYGDTFPLEGKHPWEQVYEVAKRKTPQYKPNAPNILVIGSSSPNCIDDLIIPPAVDMIDEDIRSGKCPQLRRLNGILLLSLGNYNISRGTGCFFYPTRNPEVSLPPGIRSLLAKWE